MLEKLNKKRNKKGFTLIELVVVIAILGILVAIAIPKLSGFRDRAAQSADKATAATIANAAELYILGKGWKPNEINKGGNDVNIEKLKADKLLNDTPKPQYKEASKFILGHDGDIFYVEYDFKAADATSKRLYPLTSNHN